MRTIIPGAEPFYFAGGDVGCLLVHGFSASPQEVRSLGGHLAGSGFTVLGIRLAGHGTSVRDMARTRWTDWLASVEDGYHLLAGTCKRICYVGFSTGGVLGLILSQELPIFGLALLSTPYALPPIPMLRLLYPFLIPLSAVLPQVPKGKGDWYDPEAEAERVAYNAYPLRSVKEFGLVVAHMRRSLPKVITPTLILHSRDDNFVPPSHAQLIFDELGSNQKSLLWVERSNHIITCDAARGEVFNAVSAFLKRVLGAAP